MKIIQRHSITDSKIGDASLIQHYESKKDKAISRLSSGKNMNFFALKDNYKRLVLFRYMQNIMQNPVPALINYLDLGLAHIKRTQSKSDEVQVVIFGREFNVKTIEDDYGADYSDRYELYNIAKIINSSNHIESLLQFEEPDSRKIRNPYWRTAYKYIKAGELKQEAKRKENFKNLVSISNSDITTFIGIEGNSIIKQDGIGILRQIYHFPIIDLYERIYQKDREGFNLALEKYITLKKDDIIKTENNDDSRNWIDFNLLGVLSTASRNGIAINIRTDYAPTEIYSIKSST